MTDTERAFLRALAAEHQGRTSYSLLDYERVQAVVGGLVDRGFVKQRRMGIREGLQITGSGREYLGGVG